MIHYFSLWVSMSSSENMNAANRFCLFASRSTISIQTHFLKCQSNLSQCLIPPSHFNHNSSLFWIVKEYLRCHELNEQAIWGFLINTQGQSHDIAINDMTILARERVFLATLFTIFKLRQKLVDVLTLSPSFLKCHCNMRRKKKAFQNFFLTFCASQQ